ncbi:abortive infection bacteriophage resistance protein [Natranaerovirga hydrolytica]|uniref:Abortive infection bacteriophage resistance protein n=1 Tax=Natranaerovirga hydrolytica TaxID=680378 RepID=A0A4R1N5B1_9FIRM|nr:Abi family protein [Natranaerovirga hydrolytica]TCK98169.1 abortive infection bacteriophage resistance protein [Natranaerovirga hydrolytica]
MGLSKEFKTYNEQLEILRDRGLIINDVSRVTRILEKENYYNIINGYKDLYLNPAASEEQYKTGVNFLEIYSLYEFDRNIRHIFLKQILKIENNLKSAISYDFSQQYDSDNYLTLSNFELGSDKKLEAVSQLIASIQNDIARNICKNLSIKHYMEIYGYIPFWVLVNILTFGTISKFYGLMKLSDRQKVASRYNISEKSLRSYIKLIALFRNICAHEERFYNFKASSRDISYNALHSHLNIQKINGRYIYGLNDVFALLITVKVLCAKSDFQVLFQSLSKEIDTLSNKQNSIIVQDILKEMGFPNNWKDINQY